VAERGLAIGDLDQDGDDDFVIVDRRGSVYAVRNDTQGPTVAVSTGQDCGGRSGQIVTIETDIGVFQHLPAPHSYASAHAAHVIGAHSHRIRVSQSLIRADR